MWSPRFAVLPAWRACATTVPLGSELGTYLIAAIRPASRSATLACCSVLPTTSGTVTACGCAGCFGCFGCAVVVCFGCTEVVAAGAVVAGCELDGAPAETLIRTCAPPCALSPAFGFCATTVPSGCSDGTRCVVASKPADFSSDTASDSLWPTTSGTAFAGCPFETFSVTAAPFATFVPGAGRCDATMPRGFDEKTLWT